MRRKEGLIVTRRESGAQIIHGRGGRWSGHAESTSTGRVVTNSRGVEELGFIVYSRRGATAVVKFVDGGRGAP